MKFILTKLMDDPRPHWALSNDFFCKKKKKNGFYTLIVIFLLEICSLDFN